jgi:hypothetical protein
MEIFQIVSTSVLGVIAVYIAWRHWWTDELKRRHDLYERRLKVYDALIDFFETFEKASGIEFLRQVRESRFLFSKEISIYLDEVYRDWLRYIAIRQIITDPACRPEDPEFSKLAKEKGDIAERLKFQAPIATEKFAKEMSLNSTPLRLGD